MPSEQEIELVLDGLRGPREGFREILTDTDTLMADLMAFVDVCAKRRKQEPWSLIGQITGHGSGVSSAIYELYRRKSQESDK